MSMFELQKMQHEHDMRCHQDIVFLPIKDRMNHLIFHFAKYLGKICSNSKGEITIYADIIICCLSLSNIFNFNLNDEIEKIDFYLKNRNDFISKFAISVGKMAKASEALDHIESYPYRETIKLETINLLVITISILEGKKLNLIETIQQRWDEIERKNIFYNEKTSFSNNTVYPNSLRKS